MTRRLSATKRQWLAKLSALNVLGPYLQCKVQFKMIMLKRKVSNNIKALRSLLMNHLCVCRYTRLIAHST